MKKGLIAAVVAALVLSGLAMSCKNDAQDVNVKNWGDEKTGAAGVDSSKIETSVDNTNKKVFVSWKAAQDAISYKVYAQQVEGSDGTGATILSVGYGSNESTPTSNNSTHDNWYCTVSFQANDSSATADKPIAGRKYKFGIQATNAVGQSSGIVWDEQSTQL